MEPNEEDDMIEAMEAMEEESMRLSEMVELSLDGGIQGSESQEASIEWSSVEYEYEPPEESTHPGKWERLILKGDKRMEGL